MLPSGCRETAWRRGGACAPRGGGAGIRLPEDDAAPRRSARAARMKMERPKRFRVSLAAKLALCEDVVRASGCRETKRRRAGARALRG